MIGFAGRVAQASLAQAGRQVGRQAGRNLIQRLSNGERLEDILSREELKLLKRRFGQATASALMEKGKEMFMEDFNEKMKTGTKEWTHLPEILTVISNNIKHYTLKKRMSKTKKRLKTDGV